MNKGKNLSLCNSTSNCSNSQNEDPVDLDDLNYQTMSETFPVIIYIGILMFVGIIGNTLTIYVYQCTFQKHSSTIFIISIAIYDLMGCVIAMPLEIYDLVYQYTFYSAAGCKAIHFIRNILVFGSSILLVEIAFDRYTKICRPWFNIKPSTIKWMCIFTGACSVIFSIPALVIFGITRIETPFNGTLGYDCAFEDSVKGSLFQQIYFNLLGLLFFIILSLLSGFYIKIWYEIRKRYRIVKCKPAVRFVRELQTGDGSVDIDVGKEVVNDTIEQPYPRGNGTVSKTILNRKKLSRRTTLIFSAVSGVFILTFLPAICILTWRSFREKDDGHFTMAEELIYRLHMFNNVINPVFYGFLNPQFRKNCIGLISRNHETENMDNVRHFRSLTLQTGLSRNIRATTTSTHL